MTQLSGKDLDIAVGLANGWAIKPDEFNSGRWILPDGSQGMLVDVYKPSSLWMHCGPIVDGFDVPAHQRWLDMVCSGEKALVSACRIYVAMRGGT